jgi:3-hydroxyisobutyrate dehydrogenase
MARRIVDAGFPLTIWARREASYEPYADTAAKPAGTPAELGALSDVVGVCVLQDADVEQVVAGPDGLLEGMAAGSVLAIHSTVLPETCIKLAELAAEKGVLLIDATVSGGHNVAVEGGLLVMVGGPKEAFDKAMPVFETYGKVILHVGSVGSGQRVKLINNLLLTVHFGIGHEAFLLADDLGIDKAAMGTALIHGSGASFAIGVLAQSGFYASELAEKAGILCSKDATVLEQVAKEAGADTGRLVRLADEALAFMGVTR